MESTTLYGRGYFWWGSIAKPAQAPQCSTDNPIGAYTAFLAEEEVTLPQRQPCSAAADWVRRGTIWEHLATLTR